MWGVSSLRAALRQKNQNICHIKFRVCLPTCCNTTHRHVVHRTAHPPSSRPPDERTAALRPPLHSTRLNSKGEMAAAAAYSSSACRPAASVGVKGATFGGKKIPLGAINSCGSRRHANNNYGRKSSFRVHAGSLREDLFGSKEPLFPESKSSKVSIVGAGEAASAFKRTRAPVRPLSSPPPTLPPPILVDRSHKAWHRIASRHIASQRNATRRIAFPFINR